MKSYRVAMDFLLMNLGDRSPGCEKIRLGKARGRFLATSILAPHDLPLRTQAEVEGCTLHSADTFALFQGGKGLKLARPV